jgi:hypothetical protein
MIAIMLNWENITAFAISAFFTTAILLSLDVEKPKSPLMLTTTSVLNFGN